MISAECSALLAASSGWHPLYGDRLSNHLPMALIALDGMGAPPAQLQLFAAHYSKRLTRRGSQLAALDPMLALGTSAHFEGVHRYFADGIAQQGVETVLRTWVPQLMPGVAASAFHALIRLAYGLDACDTGEITSGLAYWVVEYQSLGVVGPTCARSLQQIAADTSAAIQGHRFRPGIIIDRMAELAVHPAVQRVCLQPDCIDSHDIATFALGTYAAREDFTLLHLVTACHAFAAIAAYAGDGTRAARYLWQAVLLAYLTTGQTGESLLSAPPDPHRNWQACLQHAVTSLDDHVIKLVYTAWREFTRTQDPLYLHIAWRKAFAAG